MNVEIVGNKKALTTVRNKKKELKDLDNHAYNAGSETTSNVVDALDSVDELEADLDQSKESMYKLSYVIRVFFHKDYQETLEPVYGNEVNPDDIVVEGGAV